MEKHESLLERRGMGLMQGVVTDKKPGEIAEKALEKGLMIISAGSDVLRFVPPLIIGKEHVDEMIQILEEVLTEME